MYNLKHANRLLWLQIRAWPSTSTFWLGLILGLSFAFKPCLNFVQMSIAARAPIQIFEPFIYTGCTVIPCVTVTLGLLLMLSDAPFIYDQIVFIGLRVERRTWMVVQLAYILITTLVFYCAVLLFSMIISLGSAYAGNLWSSAFFDIASGSKYAIEYSLQSTNIEILDRFSPYQALGVTFAFQAMYGLTLGYVIFSLNLLFRRGAGLGIAVLIHLIGFAIVSDGPFYANQYLSMMVHGLPTYHNLFGNEPRFPLLWQSTVLFACINSLLVSTCMIKSRSLDYLTPNRNI